MIRSDDPVRWSDPDFVDAVSVGDILKCDQSNESYWAVRSSAAVYYAVQKKDY